MAQYESLERAPPRVRAAVENLISRITETAVKDANEALRTAGLVAEVSAVRDGIAVELVIKSNLPCAEHRRAEDITEAVLQSVLLRASNREQTMH